MVAYSDKGKFFSLGQAHEDTVVHQYDYLTLGDDRFRRCFDKNNVLLWLE
jgi:hypothetical protein